MRHSAARADRFVLIAFDRAERRMRRPTAPVGAAPRRPRPPCSAPTRLPSAAVNKGGTLPPERGQRGRRYGVCGLYDNCRCEEWAPLRGRVPDRWHPVDGVLRRRPRATAPSPAERYACGRATSGASDEQGTCTLPGGKTCDADAGLPGELQSGRDRPQRNNYLNLGFATWGLGFFSANRSGICEPADQV